MTTITIDQFEELINRGDWDRTQELDIIEYIKIDKEVWNHEDEDFDIIQVRHAYGLATVTSTLGDVVITYNEGFNFDENDPASLKTGTEGMDEVWTIEGVTVLDGEGEEASTSFLTDYLSHEFSEIDYSILESKETKNVDLDEDSDMETFTLQIDNTPDIRFTGELLASVASTDNQAMGSSYSGSTGRWTELELYKTAGGKFICHQIGRTRWQGERDRFSGKVCETMAEVKEFFGHRWLAKELYAEANIEDVIDIE